MFRIISLNYNLSPLGASSGSSRYLTKQLERSLACPEIRHIDNCISRKHTNQCDVRKVKAFCNHLGTQKYVYIAAPECVQRLFMRVPSSHGIAIHPQKFVPGEPGPDVFLHPFCSNTQKTYAGRTAFRAFSGNRFIRKTIMTYYGILLFMISQRDITSFTF